MTSISSDAEPGSLICPNAPPEAGSALFGIVQGQGQIAYISPSIPVTPALIEEMGIKGIPIENRLRFSGPCMAERCAWWRTDRCSLADSVMEYFKYDEAETSALPHCGIRASCRWFAQHRQTACGGCPRIIRKPAALYKENSPERG